MFAAEMQSGSMQEPGAVSEQDCACPELAGHDSQPLQACDWAALVDGIRRREPEAMQSLYAIFARGVRFFLLRHLGPHELDDRVHDCFVIVAESIQNGELREPERLMGYVRTVVRRQIASYIELAMQQRRTETSFEEYLFCLSDWRENPENSIMARQRHEIATRVLKGISARDRDILNRFYVLEQSQEQICAAMGLTFNQFRLLKSRAKARFGELGRKVATGSRLPFLKKS
jgi:RNA polymerase sigma-70 factor, ECF subfamily